MLTLLLLTIIIILNLKKKRILLCKHKEICYLIEVFCLFDMRTENKEKLSNYNNLKPEISKVREGLAKKVIIVPVINGALGCCTKNTENSCRYWIVTLKIEPL